VSAAAMMVCLLLAGCDQEIVTILHNQTSGPIQVIGDKVYTIPAGGSSKIETHVQGVVDIVMSNGTKYHYYVGMPFPGKGYVDEDYTSVTCEFAVMENGQIYALKTGEKTATLGEMQPTNFPVTPTPVKK
jgi:hypothetical protein